MEKLYLFAPQWQDSGITDELYHGAWAMNRHLRGMADSPLVEIPIAREGALDIQHDIRGYSLIAKQLGDIRSALESGSPERIFAIGGGCGIELPIVSYLNARSDGLRTFWFDAHGDLNSPDSSPSKHFHGMPLRFLTEAQDNPLGRQYATIPTDGVVLVGTRDLDPPEAEYIRKHAMTMIGMDEPDIVGAIARSIPDGKRDAYVHIDLDVLDPRVYRNVKCPVKDGISIETLVQAVSTIAARMHLVGLSIVENTEADQAKISLLDALFDLGIAL